MKKIVALFITAIFIASNCYSADIDDWMRGDGSIPVKGTNSESDVDTLVSDYIVDPLNLLLANYRQGCALSYTSTTVVTIGIGEVSTSDSAGTVHRFRKNTATVTVDFAAANGVGALDTGAIAASKTYYIYAVADATATTFTGIASLSDTTPATVSHYKRLGYAITNSSSQLQSTYVINDEAVPQAGLGAWVSRSVTTAYQAATDGFVLATKITAAGTGTVNVYSDTNANPTTERGRCAGGSSGFVMCPVRKGDYWKVTVDISDSMIIYWIPLG